MLPFTPRPTKFRSGLTSHGTYDQRAPLGRTSGDRDFLYAFHRRLQETPLNLHQLTLYLWLCRAGWVSDEDLVATFRNSTSPAERRSETFSVRQ
ncbi:unnamed protein product [Amoebophrya sp. A25]|nr:unnamed protein product [Amoebophrya sp. A25]|eukprot:GSA25T00012044001.1